MKWIIVGLGNPGGEYRETRHNVGRLVVDAFAQKFDLPEWEEKAAWKALVSQGEIGKEKVLCVEPETFMNNSGKSLVPLVASTKQAGQLVVIHDDLDLPLGTWKSPCEKL